MIKEIQALRKFTDCSMPSNEKERIHKAETAAYNQAINDVIEIVKNCSIPDVGQSLPDAEQCLKIQEQVKQYCYTDQDNKPVISSGGIRTIISRWKQIVG